MAQHDYSIANQSGSAFRADLNNALLAIVSNNSGSSEPTTTYAYQWWADTTTGQLKLRNAANSAWIVVQELDGTMLMEDGTAAAPGLAFASDLNTGFYRIGADQLGIATNGTAAVAIDASQRVGIGTVNPSSTSGGLDISSGGLSLVVGADSGATTRTNSTAKLSRIAGYHYTNSEEPVGGLVISNDSSDNIVSIGGGSSSVNAATVVRFFTAANTTTTFGTEAARIDSSGNVGIGQASVTQFGSAYRTVELKNTDGGAIRFMDGSSTVNSNDSLVYHNSSGLYLRANGSRDVNIWTNGTERMKIKSNGHLQVTTDGGFGGLDGVSHGFRTTTANWVAQFINDQITGTNNYGVQIKYVSSAPNGTGNSFLLCGDSAADRVQLRSNGGIANYQANDVNLSDLNAKKDITPAAGTWDCIKEWEIVNYRYKDQPDDADLNLGVIAQQVAKSCPEVITVFSEAKDAKPAVFDDEGNEVEPAQEAQPEKLGVKEQQMYWMAIKALQEAQVRIEQLEAKVAALESA